MSLARADAAARGRSPIRRLATAGRLLRLSLPYWTGAVLKHVVSTPVLARWFWARPHAAGPVEPRHVLAGLVRLRRLRGAAADDCLEAALVLYRELSKAALSPRLVCGLRRGPGGVDGHAWVEVEGRPVGEAAEDVRAYAPIAAFGERGQSIALDA